MSEEVKVRWGLLIIPGYIIMSVQITDVERSNKNWMEMDL